MISAMLHFSLFAPSQVSPARASASWLRGFAATISVCVLYGCANGTQPHGHITPAIVETSNGVTGELDPTTAPPAPRTSLVLPGTGRFVAPSVVTRTAHPAVAGGDGFQLNFVDLEISAIVSAVLGDALGLDFTIDPQIKGTMSLQATRPLSRTDVLYALEAALRLQGAALLAVEGGYRVVPLKEATRQATGLRVTNVRRPGFGIQIVPLKYVSVADVEKVLRPFAAEGAILRGDEGRNLLLLAGTSQELATLLDVVQTFDVDWLSGTSFALYPLEYAEASAIASELAQVFADPKSPIANLVKIVPLARLNSLLVVTQQAEYLSKVAAWIKQFDVGVSSRTRRVYVYEVQTGKASELAESLNQILGLSGTTRANAGDRSRAGGARAPSNSDGGSPVPNVTTDVATGGGMRIVPNEESNSLLIMALPEEFALLQSALKRLDIEPVQVLLEASRAEVTLNDQLRFGLQWAYQSSNGPVVLSEAGSGAIQQQFPGLSYLYTGRQDIQAVLNTLESLTDVKVISSPKLLVLNNREAQLQVGDQVPIATQSAVSTLGSNAPIVNSVELRDTGVILRITPRVNKSGLVLLDVAQEVSDVVPTTTSNLNSPTIQQRKLSSSVAVHDGETIALGGLIRDSRSKSRDGVPLLRRIPLLGTLFGSVANDRRRTELIVLLTPHVIRSREEAANMMDELREQFRTLRKALPTLQGKP